MVRIWSESYLVSASRFIQPILTPWPILDTNRPIMINVLYVLGLICIQCKIHQIWKNGSKKDRSQNVKGFKNYSFHACWPHERIFEICFVFTDFFARASTSLQFDIYDFRKKLFDLINFFWHELPKNHFPNSILRNVEYPNMYKQYILRYYKGTN